MVGAKSRSRVGVKGWRYRQRLADASTSTAVRIIPWCHPALRQYFVDRVDSKVDRSCGCGCGCGTHLAQTHLPRDRGPRRRDYE